MQTRPASRTRMAKVYKNCIPLTAKKAVPPIYRTRALCAHPIIIIYIYAMIDTLNMTIRETRSGGGLFDVARHIENVKEGVYSRGGEQYAIGSIGNYRVYVDSRNVRLSGSIAKLAQGGENVSSPSRAAVADGVQWLSDTLHLNVGAAAVGRVDVAYTFNLPAEPTTYIAEMSSRACATEGRKCPQHGQNVKTYCGMSCDCRAASASR